MTEKQAALMIFSFYSKHIDRRNNLDISTLKVEKKYETESPTQLVASEVSNNKYKSYNLIPPDKYHMHARAGDQGYKLSKVSSTVHCTRKV